jgi:hypothetical protein
MARKKIEPLFEEPIKNTTEDKKLSVAKSSPTKKEVPIVKSKANKKVELVKPVAKVKKSSPSIVTQLKKEIKDKTSEVKRQVKKEISIKKTPVKEEKKVLPKSQNPTVKKVPIPKIKETKIEEPEEEQTEIQEEKKPAYVKESKRKPKVDKNAPPVNKKHTLKVGTRVIVTFLGQPEPGTIIELTDEGMYKVKSNRGIVFPRAKYELGEIIDKRYPSYIIEIIK